MYIRFAAEKITLAPGKWQMVFKNAQGQQLPIEPCAFESSAIVAYRRIVDEFPQVAEVSPKRIYKCLNFKNPFNLPISSKRPHNLSQEIWNRIKQYSKFYGAKTVRQLQRYVWNNQNLVSNGHIQIFTTMQLAKLLSIKGTNYSDKNFYLTSSPQSTRTPIVGTITVEANEDTFRVLEIKDQQGQILPIPITQEPIKLDWYNTRFKNHCL